MSITRQNISVVIVSYKSDHIIHQCIESIGDQIEIIIVDNSNNNKFKKDIEEKYRNIKCILSSKNIGMGAGNNLGIKNVKNDYALILNPDVNLYKNTIDEMIEASQSLDNFGIFSPLSDQDKHPNYKLDEKNNHKFDSCKPFKVESVDGYAMLLNLKRLKNIKDFNFFDENFFLFLENDDLCKRLNKKNENIYVVPKAKINHLGGRAVDPKYDNEEFSRNWHWMWSKFYFNKKHYGYINAFFKTFNNLASSNIKFLFYFFIFNNYKKKIYQMRLSGLLNSMIGKKSFYRPKIDN